MGAMNYPSTTQALFALIVMIIVLLFILVYCCWGTFSCARQDNVSAPSAEEGGTGSNTHQGVRQIIHGPHTVIVPINNMIYVGDPETHQIYQIPMNRDKPPAYTEVFRAGPPPPYRPDPDSSTTTTANREQQHNRTELPESPPAYDECLSATPEELRSEQNPDTTSDHPQQQDTVATETPIDTTASSVTESPPSPLTEPIEEVQEASLTRTELVLTVDTLPQVSSQLAQEETSNTHTEPQRGH